VIGAHTKEKSSQELGSSGVFICFGYLAIQVLPIIRLNEAR